MNVLLQATALRLLHAIILPILLNGSDAEFGWYYMNKKNARKYS